MPRHTFDPAAPIMGQLRAIGIPEHLPRQRAMVYRFLDDRDHLLYVGVTVSPRGRWQTHKAKAEWWAHVASVLVEWHPYERSALDSEVAAIKSEAPLFNRRSSPAPLKDSSCVAHEARMNLARTPHTRGGVGGGGRGGFSVLTSPFKVKSVTREGI